jgi:hypothetical protein
MILENGFAEKKAFTERVSHLRSREELSDYITEITLEKFNETRNSLSVDDFKKTQGRIASLNLNIR